jgi:hypothetical protein
MSMDDYFEDSDLLFQSESQDNWMRARGGALVQGVICAFKNCSVDLIPFEQVKTQLHLVQKQNRGLQEIELDHIRGSVGRYQDFTSAFLPRESHMRQRWERVSAYGAAQGIAPIEVHQVGEAYFVVDGNHRVSVARQEGMKTIPAYVTEYKTSVGLSGEADLAELMTKAEYLAFLKKTRLDELRPENEILFTAPGRYQEIDCLISKFREALENSRGKQVSDEEALLEWFDLIYVPATRSISESGALERFPGRTEGDLFIWMWQHQDQLLERYPESSEENSGGNTVLSFLRRLWRNMRKLA